MLSVIGRLNIPYARNLDRKILPELTGKVHHLSQNVFFSSQTTKEPHSPTQITTEEEFVKHRMNSDGNYINRMRKAFPRLSDEQLKEAYVDGSRLSYQDYKRSSSGDYSEPGLMFRTEDFIDPKANESKD